MGTPRLPPLALAGCLLSAACGFGGPAQMRYERSLERTPEAAAHGVQSERLEQLMRGLARLRDERLPQAMDRQAAEARWETEIAEVARAMAASARQIGEASSEARLDPERRREFTNLAERLARQSQELADAAPKQSPQALREKSDAIAATCDACHQRFRIPEEVRDGD